MRNVEKKVLKGMLHVAFEWNMHPFYIYTIVDEYLSYFHFLPIKNNVMTILHGS